MSALANRLASLTKKTADLEVKDVTIPENSADPLTLFKSNSSAKMSTANEWIIDVFPNMIPILMYILTISSAQAQIVDHREHAKSSTATIAMYNTAIIYAYFLISDVFVRPTPSHHAASWTQSTYKEAFIEFLLTLPVPESLETILAQFSPTVTERRKNIFYIPSAAGFDHSHFFGRFVPLNFFSAIHDCTATLPGNSPKHDVLNDLLTRELYTISGTTYLVGNFLGYTFTPSTTSATSKSHHLNSKWHQLFNSVFNPVLFRDYQRRSTLATLDLEPTTPTSAYDILFNATPANLREQKVVFQSIASVLSGKIPMKRNLCQLIASSSGTAIFQHGYSEMPLPIWSNEDLSAFNLTRSADIKTHTAQQRASHIHFLSRPATRPARSHHVEPTTLIDDSNAPVALPTGNHFLSHWPFNLVARTDSTNPFPVLSDIIQFEDDRHTNPKVMVLNTDGESTVTAHLATLTGKIIESYEIDGCTIELPRSDKSLGLQNALFSDSLIPYETVRSAISFSSTAANHRQPLSRKKASNTRALPASTLLHDRTTIHIPKVNNDIVDNPSNIYGFTSRPTDWLRYGMEFIGFNTAHPGNVVSPAGLPSNIPTGELYVWSPYTYVAYAEFDEHDRFSGSHRTYFLTNLRSLFGTDVTLTEVVHPFEAFPVL